MRVRARATGATPPARVRREPHLVQREHVCYHHLWVQLACLHLSGCEGDERAAGSLTTGLLRLRPASSGALVMCMHKASRLPKFQANTHTPTHLVQQVLPVALEPGDEGASVPAERTSKRCCACVHNACSEPCLGVLSSPPSRSLDCNTRQHGTPAAGSTDAAKDIAARGPACPSAWRRTCTGVWPPRIVSCFSMKAPRLKPLTQPA